jgi:hypothetical protein
MMQAEASGLDYFWWDGEVRSFQSSLHVMPRDSVLRDEIKHWLLLHGHNIDEL